VKEAMACNTPVVSTNVGNVFELLNDINGSFVAKSNDVEALADLTYQAITNNEIYDSRSVLIEKKLDIDSVATQLIKLYKTL
jgi:glycosyltransferase involved in cell wall biosynthesis